MDLVSSMAKLRGAPKAQSLGGENPAERIWGSHGGVGGVG